MFYMKRLSVDANREGRIMEIWRTVIVNGEVYENYMVSNLGRVKSLGNNKNRKEKILKQFDDGKGYFRVNLWGNNKMKKCKVHRLVAMAFIPNIMDYKCIDHRDTNRKNNNVLNLTWVTHKQNMNNELSRKKKSEKLSGVNKGKKSLGSKKVICLESREFFVSVNEASRQLGINVSTISQCCNRKRKQAGKLTFRKLDQVLFYN